MCCIETVVLSVSVRYAVLRLLCCLYQLDMHIHRTAEPVDWARAEELHPVHLEE